MNNKCVILVGLLVQILYSCGSPNHFKFSSVQLTFEQKGHCINSTQCISPDGKWIVFDSRNYDSLLAGSGEIRMVNVFTKEEKLLYKTESQSNYGPGVGAATFSPVEDKVIFIAGIKNANKDNPYSFTRRTGVAIELANPLSPIYMDARDINMPFTPGALRGGTHAHSWSGDGQWISYTYNDFVLEQAGKYDPGVKDMRTIGVMFPLPVEVNNADSIENFSGSMFSVLLANVVVKLAPGSDEISKAFDECWVGTDGYIKKDGTRQKRAIAYQGLVCDSTGKDKAEIFIADIPEDLPGALENDMLAGTEKKLPAVPTGVNNRRLTFLKNGVSPLPRHWLRTTPDGSLIGFLAEDSNNVIQLFGVTPNSNSISQLSFLPVSVQGPFNFSPDGSHAAFIADGSVFVCNIKSGESERLTEKTDGLRGAVVWSPKGDFICYNQYVAGNDGNRYLQIFKIDWKG